MAGELHRASTDLPTWATKVRCTCGFEAETRAHHAIHAAVSLRADLAESEARYEALAAEVRQLLVIPPYKPLQVNDPEDAWEECIAFRHNDGKWSGPNEYPAIAAALREKNDGE